MKQKEILDARIDTCNDINIPTIDDVISDIEDFIDEDGELEQKHVGVSWLELADIIKPVVAANGEPIQDDVSLIDFSK